MSRPARLAVIGVSLAVATACGTTANPSAPPAAPTASSSGIQQPASQPPTFAPSAASPSPVEPSSSTARLSLARTDGHRTLVAGNYRVDGFAVPVTLSLPASWTTNGFTRSDLVLSNDTAFLALVVMKSVYPDPCHTERAPTPVKPGVDGLVDAFAVMAGFHVSERRDATVGGARGKAFTLSNDIALPASQCSDPNVLWIGRDADDAPVLETPSGSDLLWVVDVNGTTVLIGGPQSVVERIAFGGAST